MQFLSRRDMANDVSFFSIFLRLEEYLYQPLQLTSRIFVLDGQPDVLFVTVVGVEGDESKSFLHQCCVVTSCFRVCCCCVSMDR